MVSISSSRLMKMACVLSVILLHTSPVQAKTNENKRSEFIDVGELLPNAVLDIRYFGRHNFVGAPIDGYTAPKCLLHKTAANALKNVQKAAQKEGLNLKIFDCYRPQYVGLMI